MKDKILNLPVGHSIDWKFGLITREVYRINGNKFELTEICGSWKNAIINQNQLINLVEGKLDILSLDWK